MKKKQRKGVDNLMQNQKLFFNIQSLYKNKPFIFVLIFCAVCQLFYYSTFNFPSMESCHSGDARTYVFPEQYAQKILPRTPVYPAVIAIIKYFSSYDDIPQNIVIMQMMVFFVSIVFFYKLAELLLKTKRRIIISTIIYGTLPAFLFYNRVIRVESLAISLFIVFLFLIISFVSSGKITYGITSSLFVILLILLRPSFLFLLPCILLFWVIKCCGKHNLKKHWLGLLSAVCSFALVLSYCYYNYVRYDDFTLTDISTYNQLVICYNSDLYEYGNNNDIISDFANGQTASNIFLTYGRKTIASFVSSAYLSNPKQYIEYHLKNLGMLMPTSLFTLGGYRYSENIFYKTNIWGNFGLFMYVITSPFTFTFLILLLVFFFYIMIVNMIKNKNIIWNQAILWVCMFLQFFTGFLGAQAEYSRMIVPVMPIVIIGIFTHFDLKCKVTEE